MITYVYTTLAVGKPYFDKAKTFSNQIYKKDPNTQCIIVSNIEEVINNGYVVRLLDNSVTTVANFFNYNLKYQAIKAAISINTEYIIYVDADWRVHNNYLPNKIQSFLKNDSSVDFYFERPHKIGESKLNENACFWKHKVHPYNLTHTSKYDEAHVCNEQFMVFKNNDKLKHFVNFWEQRNQFCIENNIWTFAEGLEIGMSSIDANMKFRPSQFCEMRECFEFNNISGKLFVRF